MNLPEGDTRHAVAEKARTPALRVAAGTAADQGTVPGVRCIVDGGDWDGQVIVACSTVGQQRRCFVLLRTHFVCGSIRQLRSLKLNENNAERNVSELN